MRYHSLIPIIQHNKPQSIWESYAGDGMLAELMLTEAVKHQKTVFYGCGGADRVGQKRITDLCNGLGVSYEPEGGGLWMNADLVVRRDRTCCPNPTIEVIDGYVPGAPEEEKPWQNYDVDTRKDDFIVLKNPDPNGVCLAVSPKTAWPGKVNLVVKTRNCVPDEDIQANVKYASSKIAHWVSECRRHDELAIMVSAGPTFENHLDKIRSDGGRVVCVKHAHDRLIELGIVPWACVLLDPRSHVQDFIENPHPDVLYITASMCHPTTIDRLIERNAKILGYHAHVGAGEDKAVPKGSILIGGGSTAATRGVSVLYAMGFRRFNLYGYDSCYYDKRPDGEKKANGLTEYFDVEVAGQKFKTDPELLAQAQDFDKMMKLEKDIDMEVYGAGLIPHIFALKRRILPELGDVLGKVA